MHNFLVNNICYDDIQDVNPMNCRKFRTTHLQKTPMNFIKNRKWLFIRIQRLKNGNIVRLNLENLITPVIENQITS